MYLPPGSVLVFSSFIQSSDVLLDYHVPPANCISHSITLSFSRFNKSTGITFLVETALSSDGDALHGRDKFRGITLPKC